MPSLPRRLRRGSPDDGDAVHVLRSERDALERRRQVMTLANRIIRRHRGSDAALPELVALEGIDADAARRLLTPGFLLRVGFTPAAFARNAREIRRLADRIAELERPREQPGEEWRLDGLRVVDSVEADRLQLYFETRPDATVRRRLRARGFLWTPSVQAWQRPRGAAARRAAARALGIDLDDAHAGAGGSHNGGDQGS
jgi:hypothetical protein